MTTERPATGQPGVPESAAPLGAGPAGQAVAATPPQVSVQRWPHDSLRPVERRLLACAVAGAWLNLRDDEVPASYLAETVDPRTLAPWARAPAVRGEFLTDLVTGRVSGAPALRKGVRLRGAVVEDRIDLEGWDDPSRPAPALVLRACRLTHAPLLDQAHLAWLEISSSRLPGVVATQVRVDHNVVLTRSVVTGPVTFALARVGGQLDGTGMVVGPAWTEDGEDAGAAVPGAGDGTSEDGEGCAPADELDPAVEAFESRIGADLLLAGVRACGRIELGGAEVAGNLSLTGARVRGRRHDIAVSAARVRVHHHLYAQDCCCLGELDLFGAQVSGSLLLDRASLVATGGDPRSALDLDHAGVGGDLRLDALAPHGRVSCRGASVAGWLSTDGASLTAPDQHGYVFDGEGLRVGGRLRWCEHAVRPAGVVDLRYADVHRLEDDVHVTHRREGAVTEAAALRRSWPSGGRLLLDGLAYADLLAPGHPRTRREWLALQHGYAAQPYEQLARVYREGGKTRAAREIGIAREECRRTRDDSLRRHERWWSLLLRVTTGHGYKPWRILYFLAALLLAAVVLLGWAQDRGMLVPARDAGTTVTAQECARDYPCFSRLGYAFETVVPLVNLHQVESWSVDASVAGGTGLRLALWGLTVAGWVFVSLAVAGITSAMRHT